VLVLECISSSSSFSFINEVDMRNMIYMDKQTNKQTNKQTIKRIGTQSKKHKKTRSSESSSCYSFVQFITKKYTVHVLYFYNSDKRRRPYGLVI